MIIKGQKDDTVNFLYNDIRYNSKIRYNVNLVFTKFSGSYIARPINVRR